MDKEISKRKKRKDIWWLSAKLENRWFGLLFQRYGFVMGNVANKLYCPLQIHTVEWYLSMLKLLLKMFKVPAYTQKYFMLILIVNHHYILTSNSFILILIASYHYNSDFQSGAFFFSDQQYLLSMFNCLRNCENKKMIWKKYCQKIKIDHVLSNN